MTRANTLVPGWLPFVAWTAIVVCPPVEAVEPCEVARLLPDNPGALSTFGVGVAISGDVAVVGDPGDGERGSNAGAAYVFRRAGLDWVREAKIFGADTGFQDTFGYGVAVDGDRIVVGAPGYDVAGEWLGAAYVFELDGGEWVQRAKLVSSGSELSDYLGWSVAVLGDRVAVGAPGQSSPEGSDAGRTYIFEWDGTAWTETAALSPSTSGSAWFGVSVSLDGTRIAVGAYAENGDGAAYVFAHDGASWVQEARLTASDGAPGDFFGKSVSLSGGFVAVGAPGADPADADVNSGAVYVFNRTGSIWAHQETLLDDDPAAPSGFGDSVVLDGLRLLAGAPADREAGQNAGAAYLFERNGSAWTSGKKIIPGDVQTGMQFGESVTLDNRRGLIIRPGVGYLYLVPTGPPCIPAVSGFAMFLFAVGVVAAATILMRRRQPIGRTD